MRFLDIKSKNKMDKIIVYLTKNEAEELYQSLHKILIDENLHEHILSEDYTKELRICIYNNQNLSQFDERSKTLIIEDK